MASTTEAQLDIVLQLKDQASAALGDFSSKSKTSLDSIQSSANTMAMSFGLAGAAILGGVGILVDAAGKEQVAFETMSTAVAAAITQAQGMVSSDSTIAKQKQALQEQLTGVNAKLTEYEGKAQTSKGATGIYAKEIEALVIQKGNLKDKIDGLNNEQTLAAQNANDVTEAFKAQAEANTNLGFMITDSAGSLQKFLLVTKSVPEAETLNKVAMDLSRNSHLDLATATTQVAMAYEGNGRALKQFGINLKDGLTNMQAVTELGQLVSGQAKNFTATLSGQMQVATAKSDELAAAIGTGLIPALTGALVTLAPLIDKITTWIEQHPKLTTGILAVVTGLGLLLVGLAAIGGAISGAIELWKGIQAAMALASVAADGFGAALDFAMGPVGLIILGIALLIGAILLIKAHWAEISAFTMKVWADMKKNIEDRIKEAQAIINAVLKDIQDNWNLVWGAIAGFFIAQWDDVKNALTESIAFVTDKINTFVSWASGVFKPVLDAVNTVGGVASSFGKAVGGVVSSAAHVIGIHDAIITPGGQVIQSDPADYLIATKTPGSLMGAHGGGGTNINISLAGGIFLNPTSGKQIADMIAKSIGRSLKLQTYR